MRSLVLLHPWFGCWKFWRHTVEALPDFDTYAVDLYSLGDGEGWQAYANPHGLARAVTALVDALWALVYGDRDPGPRPEQKR